MEESMTGMWTTGRGPGAPQSERGRLTNGRWLLCLAMCAAEACGASEAPVGPGANPSTAGGDGGAGQRQDEADGALGEVPTDVGVPDEPLPVPTKPEYVLTRASKSGTIDITENDRLVAMVLPETDSMAIFSGEDERLLALVRT